MSDLHETEGRGAIGARAGMMTPTPVGHLPGGEPGATPSLSRRQQTEKRVLDLAIAFPLLILLSPLLAVLAIVIRRTSTGPAIFRHARVGRRGRIIYVRKLRTMRHGRPDAGPPVTVAGDPRITPVGRYLRKSKLDELPQLWNVITGDMSLVGPRPDVPGYADRLTGRAAALRELRPGVTGPATLHLRDEEELLASVPDPLTFNDEVLYPMKVAIDLAYLERWSLWHDLALIAVTALPMLDRYFQVVPTRSDVVTIMDRERRRDGDEPLPTGSNSGDHGVSRQARARTSRR